MPRPAPTAEGSLAKTPFAHVLLYVREHSLTGTLAVQGEGPSLDLRGETLIAVRDGLLAYVRLPSRSDPVGSVLCEMGCISDAQLTTALARGGRVGEALVAMGACRAEDIQRALGIQGERRLLRLFALRSAPYQYFDGIDLIDDVGSERVAVETLRVLWRGIQAHAEPGIVDATLARTGTQPLRWKGTPEQLELLGLTPSDRQIVERLRASPCDVATLTSGVPQSQRVRALLYTLVIAKLAEPSRPSQTNEPVAKPISLPAKPIVTAPPPPADDPPMYAARLSEATARLVAMDDETYFQMLGIGPSDGAEAVRSAFLSQAGKWHPDRVPADAPRLREVCARIFALLSEAEQTLTNEMHAARYLSSVQDGGGTPAAQRKIVAMIEAATDAQKAEVFVKRREFADAERAARRALAVAPDDPAALTVLAIVLLEKPGDAGLEEAQKVLVRTVEIAPKHDRARVLLGTLLRRRGAMDEALEQFRAALQANPKNLDAQREVRLADMRSRPSGSGRTEGGLLGKWLKR